MSVRPSLVFLSSLLVLAGFTLGSCAAPEPLALHVEWGLNDTAATIPDTVTLLQLYVDVEGEDRRDPSFTVANLDDLDGNGRRELDIGEIPPGVPTRLTIEGRTASGATAYVGHAGPFVLQTGETRYVDLRMYAVNDPTILDTAPLTPRFFHTATALVDGRVLITGGFDRLTSTTCPPGTLDPSARCFSATASASAALFDPATGDVTATRTPMLNERAGHTATVLADGRVLLAGGAEAATVIFENQEGGFSFRLVPGAGGDTFEIFDPNASPEAEDIDRDGDPGRGAFVGAADDATELGRLDTARVLHAATLLPEGRVLLAGGVASSDSYTVFDPQRAGGYGVLGVEALSSNRVAPAAVTLGTGAMARGWIFGGGDAASNDDLAELYRAGSGADVLGSSLPATMSGFPDSTGTARPEFALFRPLAEVVGGGTHALVVGWYGPRCTAGTGTAVFDAASPYCAYSPASMRSFTVNASTGVATTTILRNAHAFGASAVLSDGRVVITGGMSGLNFQAGNTIDVFTGMVASGSAALSDLRPLLSRARAMHTTVALPDAGMVTFGGIAPSADLSSITLVTGIEVNYLR